MPSSVVRAKSAKGPSRRAVAGHGIATYQARRDFKVTSEPAPAPSVEAANAPIFVVQKHAARRLHWDFRLEHGGVLWSWAVPKGPSMDPADKRLAVHVEDHPRDYASFEGRIPSGQYGAGTVEIWDRGTWAPVGDAAAGLRDGELKFVLSGARLRGRFVLVRLKPRAGERGENWLLIKEHDPKERAGADAETLSATPLSARPAAAKGADKPPIPDAVRAPLPDAQPPQLARLVDAAPDEPGWISEIKFDGYRLMAFVSGGVVRLASRNGLDWTRRLPRIAEAIAALDLPDALLDGELVALRPDGVSDFSLLKDALARHSDAGLNVFFFDLLHLNGWDLRPGPLRDRKSVLRSLASWRGVLRISDDAANDPATMRRRACAMHLEGIICKRADAPYAPGRGKDWVKLKCSGREEFAVIGSTPPEGSRTGLGSLHLGYYDADGALHYAGGVGSGFTVPELKRLKRALAPLAAPEPDGLRWRDEPPDRHVAWARPHMVVEVQYAGWTGSGRLRHAAYLGQREDKVARDVVRDPPKPDAPDRTGRRRATATIVQAKPPSARPRGSRAATVVPARGKLAVAGVTISHPDKELWPGITKRMLGEYWQGVADQALKGIARRPLAFVRCPDGIDGQHFFQKHPHKGFPAELRSGEADGAPYLVLDDLPGLLAAAQIAAIELHSWGSAEPDPLHPDRVVFDLDPGPDVPFPDVVAAAKEVRARLEAVGLAAFCRTTGGKGLHVVAPLVPRADWAEAREWCHGFARAMERAAPDRFVASVPKKRRQGRILVDWLRNGLGSTAVASFSPRARPGAGVATPLAWREVTEKLDPASFTLATVPGRLRRQRRDPWDGFAAAARPLPAGIPD